MFSHGEMARSLKLLILFVGGVMSNSVCERYEFEDNFDDLFSNTKGVCGGMAMWEQRDYDEIGLWTPFERSVSFISPMNTVSCVSSHTFPMTAGGILEVNIYMDAAANSDHITVLANQEVQSGQDAVVGTISNTPQEQPFFPGWHTLRITLIGIGSYNGYVSICLLNNYLFTIAVSYTVSN